MVSNQGPNSPVNQLNADTKLEGIKSNNINIANQKRPSGMDSQGHQKPQDGLIQPQDLAAGENGMDYSDQGLF